MEQEFHEVPYAEELVHNSWNISKHGMIMFKDPYGHRCNLSTWDIAFDGTVSPSVHCLTDDKCGFHEYIKLLEYEEKYGHNYRPEKKAKPN